MEYTLSMGCYKLRFRHVIRSFEFEYAFPSKLVLHATLESINPMNIVATFRAMEDFNMMLNIIEIESFFSLIYSRVHYGVLNRNTN